MYAVKYLWHLALLLLFSSGSPWVVLAGQTRGCFSFSLKTYTTFQLQLIILTTIMWLYRHYREIKNDVLRSLNVMKNNIILIFNSLTFLSGHVLKSIYDLIITGDANHFSHCVNKLSAFLLLPKNRVAATGTLHTKIKQIKLAHN